MCFSQTVMVVLLLACIKNSTDNMKKKGNFVPPKKLDLLGLCIGGGYFLFYIEKSKRDEGRCRAPKL